MGRMTTGAVGPAVPDRWNHCTPSSRSHCWLQPYLPLQFPAWQCLSWLREQEHPRKETMPAAPSTRTVTGWSRVPLPPWGAPSSRGPGCEKVPQANKKTPEYFRNVFSFPLHPYLQSSSQLSGQPAELLSGPVSPCPAPRDAPAATKPSQVVPSANPRVFFIIYIFFLVLFFSTLAFSHAIRLPLAPLPLPPPQALGWPRGCEVRGGSGGCGGLCIDALIAHGLRLTSLLPGKQSPWLLALLLQRRL